MKSRADAELSDEVAKRRTFAIISHPDAGKTTLTEKLLLYSGAVETAGSVRPRRNQRHATADWMMIEQARGITVTSTALQFEHGDRLFNLLDTPGHHDFGEDTYRTLLAVDSAVMVIDSAKGIESRTRKLFEVCRMRRIPVFTFVNKLDQPGRNPLSLLDEIEDVLGIRAVPLNWPVGSGPSFQGVYDFGRGVLVRYLRGASGQHIAARSELELDSPEITNRLDEQESQDLRESIELLLAVCGRFDREEFLQGRLTPVLFGSALNNFGVDIFLHALAELAPAPQPRRCDHGWIEPTDQEFSAFVFKIQANMDPLHRDSMAFLRICSGRFERDMLVHHPRLGKAIRMSRPHRLFAQGREGVDAAFPGDVVGVVNRGVFSIGDTVSTNPSVEFPSLPRFVPEHFSIIRNRNLARDKQFRKGIQQLEEEGAIQVFYSTEGAQRNVILASVGALQFDVTQARLLQEYGASTALEPLNYSCARWIAASPAAVRKADWPYSGILRVEDRNGRMAILFASEWHLEYCEKHNREIKFQTTADGAENSAW
ncbi:MAG: peptide chain release factor 3 [Bryobacteraceae bacterium]